MRHAHSIVSAVLLLVLASGCSDSTTEPNPTRPRSFSHPKSMDATSNAPVPTVEEEGIHNGTFKPTFVFNDRGAHTQMFDFVEYTRVDVGRSWEVTSQEDHRSYDHLVRQLTDGESTSAILGTCWMERSQCLPTSTSDDYVLYTERGHEIDVDLQGKTITRFVFVLERLEFEPYTGLFDGTSVNTRWRVDIFGYDE